MPYRIQEYDRDTYLELVKAWLLNSQNMMDGMRDVDNLDAVLGVWPFYKTKTPGVFFWLSSVQPGHMAEFHVLNSKGKASAENIGQFFPVIREIFTDFNLQRLTSAIPVTVPKVISGAKLLKFVEEGTIRKGAIFDGKFVDLKLMGLLKEEIPAKENKPRNRQKNRRKRYSKTGRNKSQGRPQEKAA